MTASPPGGSRRESSLFVRVRTNEILAERPQCYAFYSVFGQNGTYFGTRGDAEKLVFSPGRDVLVDPELTEPLGAANDLSNPRVGARSDESLASGHSRSGQAP
jgi:hypothetical protein